MSEEFGIERRLAAVLAADVAGFSRLTEADEIGTMRLLAAQRAILDSAIARHRGRIANTAGDSVLAEFPSVVNAVQCAVEAQQALRDTAEGAPTDRRVLFRIGIHVGDVMVRGGDLLGTGINVAARLEALAEAGGIVLSAAAHEQVKKILPLAYTDLGLQSVKNIEEPVRAFAIGSAPSSVSAATIPQPSKPLPLSDKPSIAVLPFQNMSGDPEQEYFADGIAEDVLTTLSKIEELLVIARNSSFVFKGQARDIREIGQILGARYVLEGSVRKAGNRVRLTAQLIDSLNGSHAWADRFEGNFDDVFELQDRITQDIVAALEVQLTRGEEARVWRKRSGSPLVYEHFLRGRTFYVNFAKHTHAQARIEFERALTINPLYTPAIGLLGFVLTDQARFGWENDEAATYEAALECAARILKIDPDNEDGCKALGYTCLFQRRHDEAVAALEKALPLCPNNSGTYHIAAMVHGYAGNFRKSAEYAQQAQRLSPLSRNESMADEARVRFHLGQLAAARDIASRVLAEKPRWLTAQVTLAASLWNFGNEDEARTTVRKMMAEHPNLTASRWAQNLPYRRQADLDALIAPLRLAGLPE